MVTSATGSDTPSTLGGSGWIARAATHAQEVERGAVWARCGYRSEVDPLEAVMLGWPPDTLGAIDDPERCLMSARVELAAMRAETDAIAAAYRRNGVEVHVARPAEPVPPNFVFMRDLFFMTPGGAIIARMASGQRAGEERHAAAALAAAGFPILRTIGGSATFEGADALWLERDVVMVGVGFRTNRGGADQVRDVLREQGIDCVTVDLGPGVQHLLGAVTFLDHRVAAVHGDAVTAELRGVLGDAGYQLLVLEADAELLRGRAMNLVALDAGHVLMPAGNPRTRCRLESIGCRVEEVEVGQYLKAAGGLGCLTGIVRRHMPRS